jgi:hypothetical protein
MYNTRSCGTFSPSRADKPLNFGLSWISNACYVDVKLRVESPRISQANGMLILLKSLYSRITIVISVISEIFLSLVFIQDWLFLHCRKMLW